MYHDAVVVDHGGQSVSDREHGALNKLLPDSLLDLSVRPETSEELDKCPEGPTSGVGSDQLTCSPRWLWLRR